MHVINARTFAPSRSNATRPLVIVGGTVLAAMLAFLARHVAPGAPQIFSVGLATPAALSIVALGCLLEAEALPRLAQAEVAGTGLLLFGALVGPDERLTYFSLLTAVLGVALAFWLIRTTRNRRKTSLGSAALFASVLLFLAAYSAYLVLASRDLMIADFMNYRGVSITVARLARAGDWPLLLRAAAESIVQDYSWAPALAPGLTLALTQPFSRAVYTFALIAFYAAPAAFALAILACDLGRRAGLKREAEGRTAILAFGIAAAFAAYPAGMAVAARGMPDVGGIVLVVGALRLAERLARLIALQKGHDASVARMTRRVALALALVLFAMFAFRRWYAFAAAGVVAALAFEVAIVQLRRGAAFRWREAIAAAALGFLALLAFSLPIMVDWLQNLSAHDYRSAYAAYRKPPSVFLSRLADWVGLLPAVAAATSAAFLWTRSTDQRLLRLTLGAGAVAALLFLRIQTPYVHHLYLIAPAVAAPTAAALMVGFAKTPRAALTALAGLAALTVSPLAYALNPAGLTPIAGLPRAARTDLDELERLRDWVDARARPGAKVCGLGSSYTFSGQLIDELWQLHPERQALGSRPKTGVTMSDVDTVEGPPVADLKDCTFVIVGDPVQTHLNPDYQQTVIVPSREILTGWGIGAKFRRTGEVFHLEKGVSAVVFERIAPLDDADIAALRERWRAARAGLGFDDGARR
jgi:hypothetical protein